MRFRSRDAQSSRSSSRVRSVPLESSFLLVFSSCRSASNFLAFEQIAEALGALVVQNALFVFEVALQPLDLRFFENRLGALVLAPAPLREKILQSTTVPSMPGGQ